MDTSEHHCNRCDKGFSRGSALKRHQQRQHQSQTVRQLQCSLCDKKFFTKQDLIRHAHTHVLREDGSDDEHRNCDHCGRTSSRIFLLRRHNRSDARIRQVENTLAVVQSTKRSKEHADLVEIDSSPPVPDSTPSEILDLTVSEASDTIPPKTLDKALDNVMHDIRQSRSEGVDLEWDKLISAFQLAVQLDQAAVVSEVIALSRIYISKKIRRMKFVRHRYIAVADGENDAVLILVARNGRSMMLKSIMDHVPELRCAQELVKPLVLAIRGIHVATVNILLAVGANVHADIGSDGTPLHVAMQTRTLPQFAIAVAQYAKNVNIGKDWGGLTALHVAVESGASSSIVQSLLHKGAEVSALDEDGRTPLHLFAWLHGLTGTAAVLLEHGADPDARDHEGDTPLHCFCKSMADGNTMHQTTQIFDSLIIMMVDAGCDINALGDRDRTPLELLLHSMHLCKEDHYLSDFAMLIQVLLRHGAKMASQLG